MCDSVINSIILILIGTYVAPRAITVVWKAFKAIKGNVLLYVENCSGFDTALQWPIDANFL